MESLKDRVQDATDPDMIEPGDGEAVNPEIVGGETKPGEEGKKMKPLDPELSKKFAKRIDRLMCVVTTAIGQRRNPDFVMPIEEIEMIEWGETVVDIINWYLPQINVNSPWPPFAIASVGLVAVIGSKFAGSAKGSEKPPAEPPKKEDKEVSDDPEADQRVDDQ